MVEFSLKIEGELGILCPFSRTVSGIVLAGMLRTIANHLEREVVGGRGHASVILRDDGEKVGRWDFIYRNPSEDGD
jgi:hypothetical protein